MCVCVCSIIKNFRFDFLNFFLRKRLVNGVGGGGRFSFAQIRFLSLTGQDTSVGGFFFSFRRNSFFLGEGNGGNGETMKGEGEGGGRVSRGDGLAMVL